MATSKSTSKYEQERLRLIFEYSPVAIWEEDFSAVARLKKKIQKEKVKDVRRHLRANLNLVKETFRGLKILDVNKAAIQLYGAKSKKELIANLGKNFHKDAIQVLVDEFADLINGKENFQTEFRSRKLDGTLVDVAMRVSVPDVYRDSFKRVIVTIQDISIQKKQERRLKRLAQTDGLTKLLNHSAIRFRLEQEFARAKRYHLDLSCLMIDLDRFKEVNDEHGHQKGDQVIKRTAQLIKKHLREVDIVGRYGGDEFLAILPETPVENATVAAKRLQQVFTDAIADKDKNVLSTVSIGVAGRLSKKVGSVIDLVTKVDRALYAAKKSGRNKIVTV